MNDLLSTPLHVLCIAGPDAGFALPVSVGGTELGRQMGLTDRFTSRSHLLVRAQRMRGSERVFVLDLGSSNGFSVGRKVALLPGFARNWAWLRNPPAKKNSGAGSSSASLAPGEVFLAGSNLWQVRRRPQTMSLQDALEHESPAPLSRRAFLFALPALSLLWLVGRYFGWIGVVAFLALALSAGLYGWRAVKSRRAPGPRWNLLYGLGLPARGVAANEEPGGRQAAGSKSALRSQKLATRSAAEGRRGRGSIDGWRLDLSEAPALSKKTLRLPLGRSLTLARIRFRQGAAISVREGDSVALAGGDGWADWVLAQAMLYARNDGLNAVIHASDPHALMLEGRRLLSVVQPGSPADHRVECAGRPLTVRLPLATKADAGEIPTSVHVRDLPRTNAATGLAVPVGVGVEGPVFLDLVRDGPHALVAGTTGSGKSVALRTWILQMCRLREPSKLRLVLIDYKGGAAFRDLAKLPHAEGLLTDLEPEETARAVAGLSAELLAREEALAARGFASVDEWEAASPADSPARIVCVIDEFRAMVRTHPERLEDLVDLAARGRSLGIHLIAATQSPGGVVTPAMRANLTLRVCLRTASTADSLEMVGSAAAASLPRIPGRAVVDAEQAQEVQWAFGASVEDFGAHAREVGPTLWRPSLPATIDWEESRRLVGASHANAFGWLDLVSARTFEPLTLGQSPVAVVGDYLPALQSIAAVSGAFWASVERMSAADVVHQMEHANLAGRAVVVEDLGALLRAVDEWAVGFGQEWWRSWLTRSSGVAVGVEASDYNLVRSWSRTLLSLSLQQTRALGVPRAAAGKLVAYPWDAAELASVSLVRPADPLHSTGAHAPHPALDLVATPIRDPRNLPHELNSRLREIRRSKSASASNAFDRGAAEQDAEHATQSVVAERVWLVGEIPPQIRGQLEVADGAVEVKEVSESQLLAGGFGPAVDDVLVVGRLSRHVARSVKLPGFVRADVLESGAVWACKCEAWYRLEQAV